MLFLRYEEINKREQIFNKVNYTFINKKENITNDCVLNSEYTYIKNNIKFTNKEFNNIYTNVVKVFYKDYLNILRKKYVK